MLRFTRRLWTVLIAVLLLTGSMSVVAQAVPYPPAVSVVSRLSYKCLEVDHAGAAGAIGLQWDCHRGPHQLWRIHDLGNSYVWLVAEHSGLCLQGGLLGELIRTYPCNFGETYQQWRQVPYWPYPYYKFQNRRTGWWLEVQEASSDLGKPVLTWTEHGGLHQTWDVVAVR